MINLSKSTKMRLMPKVLPSKNGFTLVELLIVMSIIGVLATLIIGSFASSQIRGRDAQRKSDLKQIGGALELFYGDHGQYPGSDGSGKIMACPFSASGSSACTWGTGELSDTKTTYFKVVPGDPSTGTNYFYRTVDPPTNQKYQIYARLENTQDKQIIVTSYLCGSKNCNFALTSANTKPNE